MRDIKTFLERIMNDVPGKMINRDVVFLTAKRVAKEICAKIDCGSQKCETCIVDDFVNEVDKCTVK